MGGVGLILGFFARVMSRFLGLRSLFLRWSLVIIIARSIVEVRIF